MWNSFVAIFRKELVHVRRDPLSWRMAFIVPVLQLLLFGFIDQTVRDLPTVVVDQDHSSTSRELLDGLRATRTFEITRITTSPHEARQEIVAGRARVAIIIPPDFHDRVSRRQTASLAALIDGSESAASAQALASVSGLMAHRNLQITTERIGRHGYQPPLAAQPIILFNPNGRTANYMIPGLVAILVQIVALVLATVAIVRERERGTLEQLLVTPVHPMGLVLGKLVPYLLIGFMQMSLILVIMRFGFSVPIHGNLLFLMIMALIYLCALLSTGLFISVRAKTQLSAQNQAQGMLLPAVFLSGYIFPLESLPKGLFVIGQLLPATHMVAIMRGVILRDAGLLQLWPSVLALLVISTFWIWLGAKRFTKVAA